MSDIEEIDLTAELAVPTETKSETVQSEVTEPINNSDFDAPEKEPELIEQVEEKINDSRVQYDSAKLAPVIIDVCETIAESFAPHLYFSTLPDSDRHALKVLAAKVRNSDKTPITTLTDNDLRLIDLYTDYETYLDTIPLTTEERKSILDPLKEVLKDVNYATTPGNALIIAIVLVLIPRLLPVGINYMKK